MMRDLLLILRLMREWMDLEIRRSKDRQDGIDEDDFNFCFEQKQ